MMQFLAAFVQQHRTDAPAQSGVPNATLVAHLTAQIDSRVAGKDPTQSLALWAGGVPPSSYARNADFWAADVDFSCKSAWNSERGSQGGGTLITPRHIITTTHFAFSDGTTFYFVDTDGATHARTQIARFDFPEIIDSSVAVLDSSLPDNVSPCPILPASATFNLFSGTGVPCVRLNQFNEGVVDVAMLRTETLVLFSDPPGHSIPESYQPFFRAAILYDSSSPIFFIVHGQAVLAGMQQTFVAANLPAASQLNTAIAQADVLAGINTGYQVALADLTGVA